MPPGLLRGSENATCAMIRCHRIRALAKIPVDRRRPRYATYQHQWRSSPTASQPFRINFIIGAFEAKHLASIKMKASRGENLLILLSAGCSAALLLHDDRRFEYDYQRQSHRPSLHIICWRNNQCSHFAYFCTSAVNIKRSRRIRMSVNYRRQLQLSAFSPLSAKQEGIAIMHELPSLLTAHFSCRYRFASTWVFSLGNIIARRSSKAFSMFRRFRYRASGWAAYLMILPAAASSRKHHAAARPTSMIAHIIDISAAIFDRVSSCARRHVSLCFANAAPPW